MFLTVKQFADRHNVSRRTVTRWRARGSVVRAPDGGIDEVASNARI